MDLHIRYRRDPIPFIMIHCHFSILLKVILLLIGWIGMVTSTTQTITAGYYVLTIYSDSLCTTSVGRQSTLLNVCYLSSTSGQYNIGVLQTDSTGATFSSFTVTSSSSSTSCTSLVTSGTHTPSPSYTGESCTSLSGSFYYSSTWSAYPSIVPTTTSTGNAFPNGFIIKEYDDDGCSTTLPRTTAFFISTSTCIPYRTSLNSVVTTQYVTASCASSALTLSIYSDSACATTATTNVNGAGTTCVSSQAELSSSWSSVSPSNAIYTCATYTYASAGYLATKYYSDSSCSTLVGMSESNLNNQCFNSAYNSAGYVTNVVQYYASDTSNTGVKPYTLSGSYTSSTCATATTTLLSGGVSSPSYTSSCMQMVDAYGALVSAYVTRVISTSSSVPTTYLSSTYTYTEYTDSSCTTAGGTSYYFKAGTSSCYPIVSTSNVIQYYLRTVCSSTEATATVDLYSDSACTTLYSTAGVAVTAAASCTLEEYSTTPSPLFLSKSDSKYQKSTCVGPAPTGQPSTQPTRQPTRQPTNQPTMRPSSQPSRQPSSQPSAQPIMRPSSQPSRQPTMQPSRQPTRQPSTQPSTQPTSRPSSQPSLQPTSLPTMQPSRQPSMQPSSQPSRQPTSQPSRQPSQQPSSRPSRQPTSQPSIQPIMRPTGQPSLQPSSQPSGQPIIRPTTQPSRQPSSLPSMQPSNEPSRQPSSQPSRQPSSRPSQQPVSRPSQQPTSQPSRQPSQQPTRMPSRQPTQQPTRRPTTQPTARPSRQPTIQPSCQPSQQPSAQPVMVPTGQPSRQPTRQPTQQPSSQPTRVPSQQPSNQPSRQPTTQPTTRPSRQPTSQPSRHPTQQPTRQPSRIPTGQPSQQPTRMPSCQPTQQPSSQPSTQPTIQPTMRPSRQPSSMPSRQPSAQPSRQPSQQPSSQPSRVPTNQPTRQPTRQPSAQPSRQPSSQPSRQPTMFPTIQPTQQPTNQPTNQPSQQPTGQPSTQPTTQPSRVPSSQPSQQPTQQPSRRPTSLPTMQPTRQPSQQPSTQPSQQPSQQPTRIPTQRPVTRPTMQPTSQPSQQPSQQPTRRPSSRPSMQPSQRPSRQPTSQPSMQPSQQPVGRPTIQPSRQPTSCPSQQPTEQPTRQPSRQPSTQPSRQPTRQPTSQPSRQPITRPTMQPSRQPSSRPSMQPMSRPSLIPSQQPTVQPTLRPQPKPSGQPTRQPTSIPTRPSSRPTNQPSMQPSRQPATLPTSQPSRQPTRQPSSTPSSQPSRQPSRQPSAQPSKQPAAKPSRVPSSQPTRRPATESPSFLPTIAPTRRPTFRPTPTFAPTHTRRPTRAPTYAFLAISVSQSVSSIKISNTASFGATFVAAVQTAMPAKSTVILSSCTGIAARRQLHAHEKNQMITLLGNTTIIYTGAVIAYTVSSGSTSLNATFLKTALNNGLSAITATLANKSYPGASVSVPTMVDLSPTASPTIPLHPPIPKIKQMYVTPGANNVTVKVVLQFSTAPLTVYCLTLKLSQGLPTSIGLMRTTGASNQFNPGDNGNVTVALSGLKALQRYQVFCYVELSDGDGSSLTDVIKSATVFNTTCCKAVTFINAPVSVLGNVKLYTISTPQSSYIFRIALESAPQNGNITIIPQIRLSNGNVPNVTQAVNATPSILTFSYLTPNQLIGQFYLYALPLVKGSYVIRLRVQGSASAQYYGGVSTAVTILSSFQPLPAPRFLGGMFANSGGYVVMSFDTATDQAGIVDDTWSCDRLFIFMGASLASCAWADLSTIRAYPSPVSTDPNTPGRAIQPGDTITLLGGKIRVYCREGTVCASNAVTATISTRIQLPLNPLIPTVNVGVPNSVGGCSDLLVDLSTSTGNGGRVWQSVVWNVASENGDPSPVARYLSSNYDKNYNNVAVPKDLLLITKYSITATLTNFLNQSASSTAKAIISDDNNLPVASISGLSTVNTKVNTILTLVGTATLTSCSQSSSLKYYWTMQDLTNPKSTFQSQSINPTRFVLNPYTLTAGSTYGVTLRVDVTNGTVKSAVLSSVTTASTTVFVLSGNVVAVVKGGLSRQNPVDRSLLLDASSSYDENSLTTALSYTWNCTIASVGKQFGQICDFSTQYVTLVTSSILVLPPNVMTIPGMIYSFGVTAISPDGRTGNQVMIVTAAIAGSPVVSSNAKALNFNFDSKLNIYAYITASQAVVGTWTASYASLPVSLSSALTSPISTFTSDQASATIVFPISFPANTFVAGRTYSFTLSASPVADSTIVSSTQIILVCNSPPTGGYVLVSPSKGYALSTVFTLSAAGWVDDPYNFPLTFSFSYSRATSNLVPPLTIKAATSLPYGTTQLPEGLASQNKSISIINFCCNVYFACANSSAPVIVALNTTTNVLKLLATSLSASLASGNTDDVFNVINLVSSTISVANCSGATPKFCAARNRFPCLEAGNPNECGSCLKGFTGAVGDGNLLCVNASSVIGRNGASCTTGSDCLYNLCVKGLCIAPSKTCPTNVPGTECSSYGTCKLTDLSGNIVPVCTVVDTTCNAVCHCESGYGAIDCSLGPKQLAVRSAARTSMCTALVTVIVSQDKSSHLLDVIVTALLSSYEFMEISEIAGQVTCSKVLNFIAMMASKGYMRGALQQTQQFYAEISSQFIPSSAGGGLLPSAIVNSTNTKSAALAAAALDAHVIRAINGITTGALGSMVEGQQPSIVVTTNIRATMKSQVITNETVAPFVTPPSAEQAQYSALQPVIQVVGSNLLKCSFGGGYAQSSAVQYGSNPHPNSASITSPLLQFGTKSTTKIPVSVQVVAAVSSSFAAVVLANDDRSKQQTAEQRRLEGERRKLQVLSPGTSPTIMPTRSPTRSPLLAFVPSIRPSFATPKRPSPEPTRSPTTTSKPSTAPSIRPIGPPTTTPSPIPSLTPTAFPTNVVLIPAYYVTLPLIGNKHYNLTQYRLSKGSKGLTNYSIPACSLYSGGKYVSCGSCNITSFTMVNVTYGCYDITNLCPITTPSTTKRRLEMDDEPGVYLVNGGGTLDVGGPLEEDEVDMVVDVSGFDFNAPSISKHLSRVYRQLKGGGGGGGGSSRKSNQAHDDLITNTFNASKTDDRSDDAPKVDDTYTLKVSTHVNEFGALSEAIVAELGTVLSLNISQIDLAKAAPVLAFVACLTAIWLLGSMYFLRWDKADRHRLVYMREYHVKAAYKLIKDDILRGGTGVIDGADAASLGTTTFHEQINRTLDVLKTSFSKKELFNPHKRSTIYAGVDELADKSNKEELIYSYGLLQGGSSLASPLESPSRRLKVSGKGSSKQSPLKSSVKETLTHSKKSDSRKLMHRDPSVISLTTSGKHPPVLIITRNQDDDDDDEDEFDLTKELKKDEASHDPNSLSYLTAEFCNVVLGREASKRAERFQRGNKLLTLRSAIAIVLREHYFFSAWMFASMLKTRTQRFLDCFKTLLIALFIDTLIYGIFYPSDGKCEKFQTNRDCLVPQAQLGGNQCVWDKVERHCAPVEPPKNIISVLILALVISVLLKPVLVTIDLLALICESRPRFECWFKSWNTNSWLGSLHHASYLDYSPLAIAFVHHEKVTKHHKKESENKASSHSTSGEGHDDEEEDDEILRDVELGGGLEEDDEEEFLFHLNETREEEGRNAKTIMARFHSPQEEMKYLLDGAQETLKRHYSYSTPPMFDQLLQSQAEDSDEDSLINSRDSSRRQSLDRIPRSNRSSFDRRSFESKMSQRRLSSSRQGLSHMLSSDRQGRGRQLLSAKQMMASRNLTQTKSSGLGVAASSSVMQNHHYNSMSTTRAIEHQLGIYSDGTLVPLTSWQRLWYNNRERWLQSKIESVRKKTKHLVKKLKDCAFLIALSKTLRSFVRSLQNMLVSLIKMHYEENSKNMSF